MSLSEASSARSHHFFDRMTESQCLSAIFPSMQDMGGQFFSIGGDIQDGFRQLVETNKHLGAIVSEFTNLMNALWSFIPSENAMDPTLQTGGQMSRTPSNMVVFHDEEDDISNAQDR